MREQLSKRSAVHEMTPTSRRQFIVRSLLASAAVAGIAALPRRAVADDATALAPATKEAFDRLDQSWNGGNAHADKTNEDGQLGWGESYALASYVLMYQAHRDTKYLDKVIDHFDRVLKNRDDARGLKDYRGIAQPAWGCAGKYTCGAIDLLDAGGAPVLRVRSACRPASEISVSVAPGKSPQLFSLVATRKGRGSAVVDGFADLSMDRSSAAYAVKRVTGQFEKLNGGKTERTMATVSDLRGSGGVGAGGDGEGAKPLVAGVPVTGEWQFTPQRYVYAVQTGMLLAPIAAFVRLVRETPELSGDARYRAKADEYLEAVEKAVAIFDHEWREDERTGEGWLVWERSSPIPFDGSDQPHNQFLALGSVMVHLSSIASSKALMEKYHNRATKMARTFKNDLELSGGSGEGAYTWTYFWTKGKAYNGWSAEDDVSDYQPSFVHGNNRGHKTVEDISHAHIDVSFAKLAYDARLGVFDEQDMKRLAATYTKNILGASASAKPSAAEFVDGTGRRGMYDNIAACGVQLAAFDRSIFDRLLAIYAKPPRDGAPQGRMLGTAWLNLAASLMR